MYDIRDRDSSFLVMQVGATIINMDEKLTRDVDIITQVLSGNIDAFENLISRYERYVFAIVGRYVEAGQVEETAHEVFVEAFRSLATYQGRSLFKSWLATIAVRKCYEVWRGKKKCKEIVFSALSDDRLDWCDRAMKGSAKAQFDREQSDLMARDVLSWALSKLSAEDRMVVVLVHIEERTVKEVASLLGWTRTNVKVRAYRSRRTLKRLLEEMTQKEEPEQ